MSLASSLVGSLGIDFLPALSKGRLAVASASEARDWLRIGERSEGFYQASGNYAQASRGIETVQAGRQAATRGRSEDVISAYRALRPEVQTAFRSSRHGVERTCADHAWLTAVRDFRSALWQAARGPKQR